MTCIQYDLKKYKYLHRKAFELYSHTHRWSRLNGNRGKVIIQEPNANKFRKMYLFIFFLTISLTLLMISLSQLMFRCTSMYNSLYVRLLHISYSASETLVCVLASETHSSRIWLSVFIACAAL